MTWRSRLRSAYSNFFVFTSTASGIYLFNKYVCFFSWVLGPSMFPTFNGHNDIVLAEAVSPWLGTIEPGDVVICARPMDPTDHVIKRVVALPGQEVLVYPDQSSAAIRKVMVPRGHVWIQGDNLLHSLDSRAYGPVPLALVKGRVLCQIWPSFKTISRTMDLPNLP